MISLIAFYFAIQFVQYYRFAGRYTLTIIDSRSPIGINKKGKMLYSQTLFDLRINKSGKYILYTAPCFPSDIGVSTTLSAGRIIKEWNYLILKDNNHNWETRLIVRDSSLFCQYGFITMIGRSFYIEEGRSINSTETEEMLNSENESVVSLFFNEYNDAKRNDTITNSLSKSVVSLLQTGLYRSNSECGIECIKIQNDSTYCYFIDESPVFKMPLVISQGSYIIKGNLLFLNDHLLKTSYTVFILPTGLYAGTGLPGSSLGLRFTIEK